MFILSYSRYPQTFDKKTLSIRIKEVISNENYGSKNLNLDGSSTLTSVLNVPFIYDPTVNPNLAKKDNNIF